MVVQENVERLDSRSQASWFGRSILISILLLCGCGRSRQGEPVILSDLLPLQISSFERQGDVSTYDRENIFDYIDGAGEVYNSFAFREVAVAYYGREGQPRITVELFDMGNSDDAYGVFSYGRENEESGIGGGYELRGGVLSFWQNRFYVCVSVEESDSHTAELLLAVAGDMVRHLPDATSKPALVYLLPSDGLVPNSDRYCHRHQTLNYHYYLARENILHLDSTTNAVLARYQPGSTLLLLVEYPGSATASEAAASFRHTIMSDSTITEPAQLENGKFTLCEQDDRYLIIVLESPSAQSTQSLSDLARTRMGEFLSQGQ